MESVDKLLENTTNRLALPSLSLQSEASLRSCNNSSKVLMPTATYHCQELILLAKQHDKIQQDIQEAKEEQKVMLELFEQMIKIEKGEEKKEKKLLRRTKSQLDNQYKCPHGQCQRLYSTEATLQRHIRLKHHIVKDEPPQPFIDLPPWPNLTGSETTPADTTSVHTQQTDKLLHQ